MTHEQLELHLDLVKEEWRSVAGFEGCYEVSSLGQIRSLPRSSPTRMRNGIVQPRRVPGRIMKLTPVRGGYLHLSLCRDGVITNHPVHRVVLEAFHGPRPPGMIGAHNDGDLTNNAAQNLRWTTYKDNEADKMQHGTYFIRKYAGNGKLSAEKVHDIRRRLASGEILRTIAADYGVSIAAIGYIKSGKHYWWVV